MPTKPINEFIPREIDNPEVRSILVHISSLIEEVINYGSHVFRWGMDSIKEGDENVPAFLMYRNIFELIDSISVLIRNSCIEPCNILLRSLFESLLNINYLFEKDLKSRGMDFLVWKRHKKILSYRRFDPKDDLYIQYEKKKAKDKILKYMPSGVIPDIEERIEKLKKLFELPSYKESSDEYERIKSTKGKPPRHWYSMHGGSNDVCQLAEHLGFPALYEILYRSWSELVHGTDIMEDKFSIEGPGVVSFSQLRLPSEVPSIARMTITFGLAAIRTLTDHYMPERAKENAEWYLKEIKDSYLNLNSIKIVVA
ncbi:MAG: DUF5677 domain-containing protein [Candidatus Aminicenantales bacterium]